MTAPTLKSPSENAAPSALNKDKDQTHTPLAPKFRDLKAPRENLVQRVIEDFQVYQEEMEFQEPQAVMAPLVPLVHLEHLALAETSSLK